MIACYWATDIIETPGPNYKIVYLQKSNIAARVQHANL